MSDLIKPHKIAPCEIKQSMQAAHCGIVVTEQILRAATTYKQI